MKLISLQEAQYVGGRSKQVFIDKFLDVDIEEPEGIQYNIKDDFVMKVRLGMDYNPIIEQLYFYTDNNRVIVDFVSKIKSENYKVEDFFENVEVYRTKRVF